MAISKIHKLNGKKQIFYVIKLDITTLLIQSKYQQFNNRFVFYKTFQVSVCKLISQHPNKLQVEIVLENK